jgi:hypothetical protein
MDMRANKSWPSALPARIRRITNERKNQFGSTHQQSTERCNRWRQRGYGPLLEPAGISHMQMPGSRDYP